MVYVDWSVALPGKVMTTGEMFLFLTTGGYDLIVDPNGIIYPRTADVRNRILQLVPGSEELPQSPAAPICAVRTNWSQEAIEQWLKEWEIS